jgi:hypothetical protein
MSFRIGKIVLLAAVFALLTSLAAFAQLPCGVANQVYCQPWDGGSNLFASQNDTNSGGFGNFATTYDNFTFTQTWDVESFHWVGGYFNPPNQGPITAWTLTFYNDANGQPGNPIATGTFAGSGGETFIANVNGFPIYSYSLTFGSFDMAPGTYWASVVPDLGFPPQWGWASGTGGDGLGYQCFFGTCGSTAADLAFAIDGTQVTPEPGTLLMLGTGIFGSAGVLRRKINL